MDAEKMDHNCPATWVVTVVAVLLLVLPLCVKLAW